MNYLKQKENNTLAIDITDTNLLYKLLCKKQYVLIPQW